VCVCIHLFVHVYTYAGCVCRARYVARGGSPGAVDSCRYACVPLQIRTRAFLIDACAHGHTLCVARVRCVCVCVCVCVSCPTASFKVKPSTAMQRLMESYCSKHHFRPEKVSFFLLRLPPPPYYSYFLWRPTVLSTPFQGKWFLPSLQFLPHCCRTPPVGGGVLGAVHRHGGGSWGSTSNAYLHIYLSSVYLYIYVSTNVYDFFALIFNSNWSRMHMHNVCVCVCVCVCLAVFRVCMCVRVCVSRSPESIHVSYASLPWVLRTNQLCLYTCIHTPRPPPTHTCVRVCVCRKRERVTHARTHTLSLSHTHYIYTGR